jgi:hypothetical protein
MSEQRKINIIKNRAREIKSELQREIMGEKANVEEKEKQAPHHLRLIS